MNEWIKIKDRIPEESVTVLTYDSYYICTAEIFYIEEGEINWIAGTYVFTGVTHWMPLPEAPKKEE